MADPAAGGGADPGVGRTRASPPSVFRGSLWEVAALFLKLGVIAFGGPAAHVAMMRREVVDRRGWIGDQEFLDLFGAANLIPGPSSTEMAIFLGYVRAGWPALILAGTLFILPAMLMVLALAWAYVRFGSLPQGESALYGIKPVIIAIIAQALWQLSKGALKDWLLGLLAAAVILLYARGESVLALLVGAGAFMAIVRGTRQRAHVIAAMPPAALPGLGSAIAAGVPFSMPVLFLTFLKIGAVAYGSGYVLLAFLRTDFVVHLHWLTDRQLIDAIAVGHLTPGPVFTTATFVGYLTGGLRGALLSTLGIFLPSFIFVALIYPLLPRVRRSPTARAFLDGATAAALGLMAAVTWQLGRAAVVDVATAGMAVATLGALLRFRVNSAVLVIGGALLGIVIKSIPG
ncbi:MAG TPA: chromate efflux transporter [bacterium]|nr:chromate efflux transporter [bacterium]